MLYCQFLSEMSGFLSFLLLKLSVPSHRILFTPVSITPLIDTEDARFDLNGNSITVLCSKKTDTFISSENICKGMEKYDTNFMKQKIH